MPDTQPFSCPAKTQTYVKYTEPDVLEGGERTRVKRRDGSRTGTRRQLKRTRKPRSSAPEKRDNRPRLALKLNR